MQYSTHPAVTELPESSAASDSGDCVFCGFLARESRESQKIYEDEIAYAMLDDYPMARGHTLVILKSHCTDLSEVHPDQAAHLGRLVAQLSKALKTAVNAEMVYVASLGESVNHVHYHLVPRYAEDKKGFVHFFSARRELGDGERIANQIKVALEDTLR